MRWLQYPVVKPLVFIGCACPLGWLVWAVVQDQLGANPAEAVIRYLGDWTLRMLILVLAVTPVRVVTGWAVLARWRRMLGLFVFTYVSLHWLAYVWLDMGFEWGDVVNDVPQRPFILVGTLAWLLLLALAVTSWNGAIRWLGAARWRRLHQAVYVIAGLAILHFFWMRAGKHNFGEVLVYAAILGSLLGWRLWRYLRRRTLAA